MLHDKEPSLFNHLFIDDNVWDLFRIAEVVRGVGEDKVELLLHGVQILERVCFNREKLLRIEFFLGTTNELEVEGALLHAYHVWRSSRNQFESDTACSGKKIERGGFLPIHEVVEHVKKALLGEIGRGARLQIGRNLNST